MISESFSYYVKSPEKQTLAGDRNSSGIGSIMRNDTDWNWKKKDFKHNLSRSKLQQWLYCSYAMDGISMA